MQYQREMEENMLTFVVTISLNEAEEKSAEKSKP